MHETCARSTPSKEWKQASPNALGTETRNENLEMHHRGIESTTKISATSARFNMLEDGRNQETCKRVDNDWLAKIAKKWKAEYPQATWTASKTLLRKLDIDIAGGNRQ